MKRPTTPPQLSPQERLRYARRALKQAATLAREAASLGTMTEATREMLRDDAGSFDLWAGFLATREREINAHMAALRARRSRKAA